MKRSDLQAAARTGQVLAYFEYVNSSAAAPIKVLEVGERAPGLTGRTISGIKIQFLDPNTLQPWPNGTQPSPASHVYPGKILGHALASRIKMTWEQHLRAEAERSEARRIERETAELRARQQQERIDHLHSLLPENYLAEHGFRFEPGTVPRMTVTDIISMLKAARTAALAEAFDGDDE